MTKIQIRLLKDLIEAEQTYQQQMLAWQRKEMISRGGSGYPEWRVRVVEIGPATTYRNVKTAQGLVDIGLAEWDAHMEDHPTGQHLRLATLAKPDE